MGFFILFPGGRAQGGQQNGPPHEYFKTEQKILRSTNFKLLKQLKEYPINY
jgi:hypothetical protein